MQEGGRAPLWTGLERDSTTLAPAATCHRTAPAEVNAWFLQQGFHPAQASFTLSVQCQGPRPSKTLVLPQFSDGFQPFHRWKQDLAPTHSRLSRIHLHLFSVCLAPHRTLWTHGTSVSHEVTIRHLAFNNILRLDLALEIPSSSPWGVSEVKVEGPLSLSQFLC